MALAVPEMSLPWKSTRSLPCGTVYEAVTHRIPWHSVTNHFAAAAGARLWTDTGCTTTVAGSVQQDNTDSQSEDRNIYIWRRVASQAWIYASVFQERSNRLELRESPFTLHFVRVLHDIVVIQHASLSTLSTRYLRSISSRNNWMVSIV